MTGNQLTFCRKLLRHYGKSLPEKPEFLSFFSSKSIDFHTFMWYKYHVIIIKIYYWEVSTSAGK